MISDRTLAVKPTLRFLTAALLALMAIAPLHAENRIQVVTTTPDLAWAAQEIGKERVEVKSLLTGIENPHYVDARPDLIRAASKADVLCMVGLELEVGWIPKVLAKTGNAKIQSGGPGFCNTGKDISVLQKPTTAIDRSMGDVHPFGNPHYWLSPAAMAEGSAQIRDALARVDSAHAEEYSKNHEALKAKLGKILSDNRKRLEPALAKIQGPAVIEYHQEFVYFFQAYGITSFGSIEEKPGVPPSASRLGTIASQAKAAKVRFALASEYSPIPAVQKFSELSGIPHFLVPTSLVPKRDLRSYEQHQKLLVDTVLKALGEPGK